MPTSPRRPTVSVEGVSPAVISLLQKQLREFGATVTDDRVISVSGEMTFRMVGSTLEVFVEKDFGHFPRMLLIGGIRQMIQEAMELAGSSRGAHASP